MITFFTVPKPFRGPIDVIQRNAITNWVKSVPGSQVIVFGDEPGVAAAASEIGVEHVPELRRSSSGAPLLDGVFREAQARATHDALCFTNADIVFCGDVAGARAAVSANFLVIGQSLDVEVREPLRFDDPAWRERIETGGIFRGTLALDFFLFSRDLFGDVPPFALGRARYDNWLVWRALHRGAMVVDATDVLGAIHQRHDYHHLPGGRREAYRGVDARRNEALAGAWCYLHLHGIHDARWRLTAAGLRYRPCRFSFLTQLRARLSGLVTEAIASRHPRE